MGEVQKLAVYWEMTAYNSPPESVVFYLFDDILSVDYWPDRLHVPENVLADPEVRSRFMRVRLDDQGRGRVLLVRTVNRYIWALYRSQGWTSSQPRCLDAVLVRHGRYDPIRRQVRALTW